MTHGHLLVFERQMIHRYAKWGSDLVLPRVAFADVTAVVEQRTEPTRGLKVLFDPFGEFHHIRLVPCQWNDRDFDWSEIRMQVEDGPFLAALELLLFKRIHQKGQCDPVDTARGF